MITTVRSSRLVRLLIALGTASAIAGGAAAFDAQDAHAMRCDINVPSTMGYACGTT